MRVFIPWSVFVLLAAALAGCTAGPEWPLPDPAPSASGETSAVGSIRGQVVDAQGRPVPEAVVVVGHSLGGTIVYGGGSILSVLERRAAEMPGVGKLAGHSVGRAITGSDGRFTFEGLAAGSFTLVAVRPDLGITILADVEHTDTARVELSRAATVRADLSSLSFDPRWDVFNLECESPWPNVQLTLRMEKDGDGLYAVTPVPAGCVWSLVQRHRSSVRGYEARIFSMEVEAEPGRIVTVDVGAPNGVRLTGRVIGPGGAPLDDVAVLATPRTGDAARGGFSSADGSYAINGLSPGEYELTAVRHRLRSDIGCGNGPVDVRVSKLIRVPLAAANDADIAVDSLITTLEPGDAAPVFAHRTVSGETFSLESHRGKVVLVDFWATWCGVCLADMKYLAQLHEELHPRGIFEIVSVSLDVDHRAVERFLARQSMPWPQIVLGPAGVNPIAKLYNANSTPTLILVDQQGRIAAKHIPGVQLREEVLKLLPPAP